MRDVRRYVPFDPQASARYLSVVAMYGRTPPPVYHHATVPCGRSAHTTIRDEALVTCPVCRSQLDQGGG